MRFADFEMASALSFSFCRYFSSSFECRRSFLGCAYIDTTELVSLEHSSRGYIPRIWAITYLQKNRHKILNISCSDSTNGLVSVFPKDSCCPAFDKINLCQGEQIRTSPYPKDLKSVGCLCQDMDTVSPAFNLSDMWSRAAAKAFQPILSQNLIIPAAKPWHV
jgi:hypothetical protein